MIGFGSNGSNIYKDPEFKGKEKSQVEKFLKENNIIISMTLKEDLEVTDSLEIEIRRNFLNRKEKIFEINGEKQTIENFPKKLKEIIFKSRLAKPTFRQIIAKNIRDEKNRIANTLKVLDSFSTKEEYESLFLFWLGIELDTNERKQQLTRDQRTENNLLERLKKEASLSQIDQSLIVVNRTIEELTLRKNDFVINESYEGDLEELNKIKLQINERSTAISCLVLRRDLILESKIELENEVSSVDDQQIKSLYQEAKVLIPELQKSFEDTIRFHNQMILHKVEYIAKEIPDLEEKLAARKREMSELLVLEGIRKLRKV